MASNSTILDPQGDADDWIELKNTGTTAIDLSGMYLSDDRAEPKKWQFPAGTTIDAGGYLIIWADDDDGDSPGLHTNFKLSAGGESVVLSDTDANGNVVIDTVDFPALGRDESYGRTPEGSGLFRIRPAATPGALNPLLARPTITAVALTSTPSIDADGDNVAETYGAGETIAVTVTWDADVVWDVSAPDAAIKLDLDIGGHTKRISMVADGTSGTARSLVFHYVVQNTDTDADGIFPKPFGTDLVLLTRGATLTSADGGRTARRAHAALAPDLAHQVDGSVAPSTQPSPPRARALAAGLGAHGERRADDAPTLAFLPGAAQERRMEPHRLAGFPIGVPVAASGTDPLTWTLDDPEGLFAIDSATGQMRMAVDGAAVFAVLADGWFRWHDDPTPHYLSLVFDVTVSVTDAGGREIETAVAIRVTADTPGDVDLSSYAPQVGQAIHARVSDSDGVLPDTVRWQWEVDDGNWQEDDAGWLVPDWQAVEGATGATFTPSADLAGSAVRAVVSYADGLSGPDEPAKQAASASTDASQ